MGMNWLSDTFLQVLHMSITAGMIICMVFGIRLCLRRAPKLFSYLLWSVVLFRLLCPVAVESHFSVLGIWQAPSGNGTPSSAASAPDGEEDRGAAFQNTWIQNTISGGKNKDFGQSGAEPFLREYPKQTPEAATEVRNDSPVRMLSVLWILGIACMAGYGVFSTVRLRKRLAGSVCEKDNIYRSDAIDTPFAMGILAPKIYLPGFLSEKEKGYIILHEQTHIRRGDLLVKLLAFAALAVHWFNPLAWAAFFAAEKDMEMSCDEMVMKQMKEDIRADYSTSLLCLATGKTMFGGTPFAFGEGNTKSRIQNIMQYRKPAQLVIGAAAILVIGCLVGFGTNPDGKKGAVPADTEQENPGSEGTDDTAYEKVYSVELDAGQEQIPFEIWVRSDSDKMIKIDGQEIWIDPEFAARVNYEQVETTIYHDFTGDGTKDIALIDTGAASGGAFQTVQVFCSTDGQWKELELPSDIYSAFPAFVTEKLRELDMDTEDARLAYHRTVTLSYENEKIRMSYKLFTEDLTAAVGTIHKDVVYSAGQKEFVLEDDTLFTQAVSGESAYHDYENTYSAELGEDHILFEIWADSASGNKVIRIDGQEIPIASRAAAGKYGGIVETNVYDYTGDGTEEIVLVDCGGVSGSHQSFLVFGKINGTWEELALPSEIYGDGDPEFWKKGTEQTGFELDDSVYGGYRTVSFENDKILIGYMLYSGSEAGPAELGIVQKELLYSADERKFVWGDTSWIPYENREAEKENLLYTEYEFLGNLGPERVWINGTDAEGNQEQVIYSTTADITHDGIKDRIDLLIDTEDRTQSPYAYMEGMGLAYIKAYEGAADGSFSEEAFYVSREVAHSHAGNGQIALVRRDGEAYLLIGSMYEGQGSAEYRFAVFYLDTEQKTAVCADEGLAEFKVWDAAEVSVRAEALKKEEVAEFCRRLGNWTEDAVLFVSCDIFSDPEICLSEPEAEYQAKVYYDSVWNRE